MTPTRLDLEPLDLCNASATDYATLHAFTNRLRAELKPDDPPTTLEDAIAAWRSIPDRVRVSVWVAREGAARTVVARGQVSVADIADNRHVAQGSIQVLPERRRRGLGREMAARIGHAMRCAGRGLLLGSTSDRVPAGSAFAQRLGGERGLETHVHQLGLTDLDRGLVRRWRERALERASDYDLEFWDGPYADADLVAAAELRRVMNTQPLGALALEARRPTPEELRLVERALLARGVQRWTLVARERASGRLVGFTEAFWRPGAPEVLTQGDTGVYPEHRGRGLGRWLKVEMLERVLAGRPQVRFVRTTNADANASMLAINRELGFEPYESQTMWQVTIERLEARLARGGD